MWRFIHCLLSSLLFLPSEQHQEIEREAAETRRWVDHRVVWAAKRKAASDTKDYRKGKLVKHWKGKRKHKDDNNGEEHEEDEIEEIGGFEQVQSQGCQHVQAAQHWGSDVHAWAGIGPVCSVTREEGLQLCNNDFRASGSMRYWWDMDREKWWAAKDCKGEARELGQKGQSLFGTID
ncbi:hypothetical protein BU17DRAFT_63452 [Hysterangium stoloniferum]|nr:hypothetical protein BU17DRAFT_63452 [Hysterangium stoloniferum]